MKRSRVLAVGIAVLLSQVGRTLSGPPVGAQQPPAQEPQPPRPTFRTGADFIRVDVFATKDGTPIHDLQREDFEVLEDGKPQKVETFEHVLIRAGGPQDARVEPNTVREAAAMATDPRARVFALFLDTHHVTIEGAHRIRQPLVNMLDRMLGANDLVGVMTPYDSARDLTLARKTIALQGFLEREWPWGERDRFTSPDPADTKYLSCFGDKQMYGELAQELTDRRREKRTLDALRDLVLHLNGIREERKAILVVTDGWLLYRPDDSITRLRTIPGTGQTEPMPGVPPIGVGPGGKITLGGDRRQDPAGAVLDECNRERAILARIDDERDFRELLELANRANASFYPIDPRGLTVFDTSIGGPRGNVGVIADSLRLRGREESIRTMAGATDGLAVVGSNNIDSGLRKISDDLTSYYLLGYYSPAGTDGRFHAITVRVKRPGVSVRARRGYRAAKPEEVAEASLAAADAAAPPNPVTGVLAALASVRQGVRLHLRAAPGAGNAIAVIGEIDSSARSEWALGGTALIEVLPKDGGRRLAAEEATFAAGKAAFLTTVELPNGITAPGYTIRVRVRPLETGGMPLQDSLDVSIARAADGRVLAQPILFRRGPTTGAEYVPSADPRFRRSDRIRLELAVPSGSSKTAARLLDRTGKPLAVPVTLAPLQDPAMTRLIGDLTLAPLTMGDYIIEVSYEAGGTTERSLTPFRIVP